MSGAEELLAELGARGVSVVVEGGRLRLRPRSALSESLIGRIRTARMELVTLLRAGRPGAAAPAVAALQWWTLWAIAQAHHLARADLHVGAPAPGAAVEDALSALIVRREVRVRSDGTLELNAC
jgi:hypothetical protein